MGEGDRIRTLCILASQGLSQRQISRCMAVADSETLKKKRKSEKRRALRHLQTLERLLKAAIMINISILS